MNRVYLCLSEPEEHMSPSDRQLLPSMILRGRLSNSSPLGSNTVLFSPGSLLADGLYYENHRGQQSTEENLSLPFDFNFFTQAQRVERNKAYARLARLIGSDVEDVDRFYPFLAVVHNGTETTLYHHLTVGRRGSLFVAYDRLEQSEKEFSGADVFELIRNSRDKWQVARRSFNNACWYSKWRPDIEMERKYTFDQPVDTWVLTQNLYREIRAGHLTGFIPEFNDEFQVWDFDNYLFEVVEPDTEAGYVSFIPQSNGLVTVKRKRFNEDSEIRQETLTGNVDLGFDRFESYAEELCGGRVRALPPFRRKRFDLTFESLDTGNVYGIFLDICRLLEDDRAVLYQCEVEYRRSRVMGPITRVVEEYEQVCDFTKGFLAANAYSFTEGYYSKLSFLRDCVRSAEEGMEVK